MQLKRAINQWLKIKDCQWTSEKVRRQVRVYARGWVEVWGADREVRGIRAEQVEELKLFRDNGERSGSALNQERTYLRQFCRWCMRRGWRDGDPTDAWETKKEVVRKKYVFLSMSQLRELVAAAQKMGPDWLPKFIVLAACTGQRESAIRAATWGWLGCGDRIGQWWIQFPAEFQKNRQPLRLPLAEWALRSCRWLPGGRFPEGERERSERLVPGMPGEVQVWRWVKRAAKAAGLDPALGPHDLRRTFSGLLAAKGVESRKIQQLGGWRAGEVFHRRYFPQMPEQEAREIMEFK